jgi:hypothetical protein
MKIRIIKAPLTQYQSKGQVDENSSWIREMLGYEKEHGAPGGTPHPTWGWNKPRGFTADNNGLFRDKQGNLYKGTGKFNKPKTIEEAEALFREQYLPDFVNYPLELRKRLADYSFNTGRNVNDLLLYNAGKIDLDQLNSPSVFTNEWTANQSEIEKMYSDPNFISKLDSNKENVYKTTGTYDIPDPKDSTKTIKTRYSLTNPNPEYEAGWLGRINVFRKPKPATGANVTAPAAVVTPPAKPAASALNTAVNTAVNEVKTLVPKVKPVVNNAIIDIKNFIPKVGPAIGNAINDVKQFAATTFKPSAQTPAAPTQQPAATVSLANSPAPVQLTGSSTPSVFTPTQSLGTAAPKPAMTPSAPIAQPAAATNQTVTASWHPEWDDAETTMPVNQASTNTPAQAAATNAQPEPARRWHAEWDDEGFDTDPAGPLYQPNTQPATKKPLLSQSTANKISDWSNALLTAGSVVDYFGQNKKIKDAERSFRQNQFDNQVVSPMFRGNWNINTGRYRDNVMRKPNEGMFQMGGEENFANISNMIKIRITGKPENLEFKYGGQSGYGLDLGQRRVQTKMPQSKADLVSNTIQEVPRYAANIEAEKGETVYGDIDGDGELEHMKIGGKRHSEGGTPLNVPEGSFIFSDTAKMKIKDAEVLKYFGLPAKKGGYTPAEIAKRYDINKYKGILEDVNSDDLSKNTAQLMVSNYNKKLAALAMVQEQMKGFPQGMPSVAQQGEGEEEMAMGEYGGYLPKAQGGGGRVAVWDEDEQKALQDYIKQRYNIQIPVNARDTDPNSQRFTLPTVQKSRSGRRVYGDEDWTSADNMADFAKRQKKFLAENPGWDPTKVGATEKFQKWYNAERAKKGMKSYFGKGQGFQEVDDEFGEYTFSAPDIEPTEPTKEIVPDSPIGYVCLGLKEDGTPNIQSSSYKDEAALAAAGAYKSAQEASMYCPGETIPGKIPSGEIPPPDKVRFLTQDKLGLLGAALYPPQAYLPYVSELPYRQGDLALEDWLAKAQQRQQTFNTAATTLGQYQPGTAMASNLSFLAGQTGEGVAQDIAQVDSRNVDRANQFMNMELQRKTANDAYNANARDKRWDSMTITKQNLDNARRKYTKGIIQAAQNAISNRGYLDMLNKVNPVYNVDPTSFLSYFKEGYGPDKLGMASSTQTGGGMDWANVRKGYNAAKQTFGPDLTLSEYMRYAAPRSTYSDTDYDGIPNSVRTSMMGQAMPFMYMNGLQRRFGGSSVRGGVVPPAAMMSSYIGPWDL